MADEKDTSVKVRFPDFEALCRFRDRRLLTIADSIGVWRMLAEEAGETRVQRAIKKYAESRDVDRLSNAEVTAASA